MPEPIITKRCSSCTETKPISEFHKNRTMKDGYQTSCKSCHRESKAKYQKTERGKMIQRLCDRRYYTSEKGKIAATRNAKQYNIRYPDRSIAGHAVNHAITSGRIPRPDALRCSCGAQAKQYHHPSYAPGHHLDVIPLCIPCHNLLRSTLS